MHEQVRHGQYNTKAKSDADAILTAAGRQQAQVLGDCVADRVLVWLVRLSQSCMLVLGGEGIPRSDCVARWLALQLKKLQRRTSRAG